MLLLKYKRTHKVAINSKVWYDNLEWKVLKLKCIENNLHKFIYLILINNKTETEAIWRIYNKKKIIKFKFWVKRS